MNREVAVSWSNEQQRYLLVNSTPIFDRHGKIRGAVGVFQDITQRKQVEQAALEKERRIAEILNSITDCYYGLDTQWRITEMNPNGLAYYGFSRQDVIGRYIWDVFPVYRKSEIEANYLRAVTSGLPAHFEMHSLVVDRWAEFHAYPSHAGLSVYFRDISERKKAEEQLRQAKDELEIRVQERTHELKQLNEELHSEIHERVLAESALNKIKQDLEQRVEQRTAELQKVNLDLSYELAEGERAEKERELLLEQLENERQRWQATVESMLDPVTVCDSQGRSIYMNAAYSEMVNRTINADISLDDQAQFYQLYHPDGSLFQPGDLPLQKAALEDVEVRNVEIVQRASTGEEHVTVWNAAALHDRNGQVSGAVAVGRDITRQRQAEAALISYAKKLEQSNRDLEDFAFIASHDLQEPLRKIHAFGSRLKEKASQRLGPDELDFLDRMMKASTRMTTMINDLLAYSRVTTKARPHEKVDLTEVAEEVLSDLEFHIERTKGQVDIAALPVLEADRAQMRALFQNLIGNALKFHREGVAPVIHVYSEGAERTASSGVKIYIADNGIGFDERYLSRLFQPFQRLHGRSEYEGSGIGLAICRKIVARHGGSITARSQPGNGSTFIITLPLVQIKGSR